MLTNPIAPPKVPATRLKNVVLSDAPDTGERPSESRACENEINSVEAVQHCQGGLMNDFAVA
jgi:hypothetical protein